jgi:hypothetical protein
MEALGINFTNKRFRLGDIKKFLAQAKKMRFYTKFLTKQKSRYPFLYQGITAPFLWVWCKSQIDKIIYAKILFVNTQP